MAPLSREELDRKGFKYVGKGVLISDKASFYNPANVEIGDFTRIDDFCVLSAGSGGIKIGRNVHIAVYTSLIGRGRITVSDFSNLSSRVAIYSSNDDYSGEFMTNPTVDERFTNVTYGDVFVGKHVIVGSGSIILPGVRLEEGVCIGALSLVRENCQAFCVYGGVPARFLKTRSRKLLELEKEFLASRCEDNST